MVRPIVAQAGVYRPSGMLERMWSGEQTILHQQGTLAQLAESWRVMPQLLGQAVGLEQHSAPQHLLEYEGQNECGAEPSVGKVRSHAPRPPHSVLSLIHISEPTRPY